MIFLFGGGGTFYSCGTLWLKPKLWSPHHWCSIQDQLMVVVPMICKISVLLYLLCLKAIKKPSILRFQFCGKSSCFEFGSMWVSFHAQLSSSKENWNCSDTFWVIRNKLTPQFSASTSNFPMYPIQNSAKVATSRNLRVARWGSQFDSQHAPQKGTVKLRGYCIIQCIAKGCRVYFFALIEGMRMPKN